jgi:Reverse transcriptase (RNA-dependent DNA polymerase).
MEIQLQKLKDKKTWSLVPRPTTPGVKILPGKWVYDLKLDADGYIEGYRARWVVCGNYQQDGIDFEKCYSPVVSEAAVKIFLTLVAVKDLYWLQCDIITAYLNAALEGQQVFMQQPVGFSTGDSQVCRLQQALYGLRQSAYLWNQTFTKELKDMGFKPLQEDPCILIREGEHYVVIYVDDMLIAATTEAAVNIFINEISERFGTKVLGEPSRFLGCKLFRDRERRTITMSQASYVPGILQDSGLYDGKQMKTSVPMKVSYRTEIQEEGDSSNEDRKLEFQTICGKVNWLAIKTRPDIAQAVNRLQRKANNPSETDMTAAKHLLRFLRRHLDYGIELGSDPEKGIEVYVDASHQDNPDGKSTEGYVIKFMGSPISWSSKKQKVVAPSTTVAEFCALDSAVKEAIFIKKLAIAFGLDDKPGEPIPIYTDAANATFLVENNGYRPITKWLDNRYFFIRDAVTKQTVRLLKIDGKVNPADGLTKPLEKIKFEEFCTLIGRKDLNIKDFKDRENVEDQENVA